jgi:hypothetical protein
MKSPDELDALLLSLSDQLAALSASFEVVVIGGAGLQTLGVVRPTRDVDVLAFREGDLLVSARPLPEPIRVASARVAADYGLDEDWLNPGPTDLLRWGLPDGFMDRLRTRRYGPALTVHFAGRYDQVHFKLYAVVDQGAGRHEADLRALEPTPEELMEAARWARTHDPSPEFHEVLVRVLDHFGIDDADLPADLRP